MKNEPCIRLGMRISPKIREKPADSRNSRPPSAMLFTARRTQTLMLVSTARAGTRWCRARLLIWSRRAPQLLHPSREWPNAARPDGGRNERTNSSLAHHTIETAADDVWLIIPPGRPSADHPPLLRASRARGGMEAVG